VSPPADWVGNMPDDMPADAQDRPRFMSLLMPRQEADEDTGDDDDDDDDDDDKKKGKKKSSKKDDEDDNDDEKDDRPKSKWPLVILAAVVVLVVIAGVVFWFLTRNQESTDDAYTEGNAVAIAPKVAGYVIERNVDDNSFVHAGDVMLRIDPRDYITARDQAQSNLDLARAQLRSAEIDLDIARVRYPADRQQTEAQLEQARANQINAGREYVRQHTVDRRATTQSTIDQATTQFEAARANTEQIQAQLHVASLVRQNIDNTGSTLKQRQAQVEQAEASLAQAELNLSYTYIRAPQDGWITRRNVDVGTYAQVGQQVFYVVSPQTWVVANFKETQLDRMHIGQHVTIAVDAYSKLKLHGHIDSIQQGSGARFTTFPSENATGNYVKIVRRVPVKIVIDDGIDPRVGLPLGLSVEPTVDLK
jgi:membrane fusion protein (multidrug efflux system)